MEPVVSLSAARYAAAAVHLYSRLWLELEVLCETNTGVEERLELFRLELVVLLDACDSYRWRSLLPPAHLEELRTTLEDVFDTLAVAPQSLGLELLLEAQNRLFEAVLSHRQGPAAFLSNRSRTPRASCNSRIGSPISS